MGNILLTSGSVTQVVLVTMHLNPPAARGDVTVSPASLGFSYQTQTAIPASQQIIITDVNPLSGFIPLTVSLSVASPGGGQ